MKNAEIAKSSILAVLVGAPLAIKTWIYVTPQAEAKIKIWFQILQASRSRRNIFPTGQAFELGWSNLKAAIHWWEWVILVGIFMMSFQAIYWCFIWLHKRAMKEHAK